ncbi:MAG TPA: FAD-dependent oxidoreductase [Thermomicrobiales bacterium]|nr:FAD-dependent oxidoreductase [Thermomicrobiales bacterium]
MDRIVVLGGGVLGASAAFHLAGEGVDVTLIDRHDRGHATAAGAGIIAPGTSLRDLPAFYSLAADAVRYYPELIGVLNDLEAGDTRYEVVGYLFPALTDDEHARLDEIQVMIERRYRAGMPNLGEVRRIDAREARERFPAIGDVAGAIFIPEAARVDGDYLRRALMNAAARRGAHVIDGEARLVSATETSVEIEVSGDRLNVDRVIVAPGAWSNSVLEPLGVSLPLHPQKGQIMHLVMEGADTSAWPIIGGFGSQYILTFGPDRVVCGATRETGSGFDLRVTAGGLHSVTTEALRVAPGLAGATLVEVRVGLRPLSDDGYPFIDRVPGHEAVVVSTGHGPSGLQLGPWSGRLAAELATGKAPSSDISAFRIGREMPVV